MTAGSMMVLDFLKKNFGTEFTKNEIAAQLGVSLPTVVGATNNFNKRGFLNDRSETVEVEPATETRKAKVKEVHHISLNEAGLAYDPVAEEAAKAAAKASKTAEEF
jgi:Mn-dependent DtxR family transcriptional regulator